MVARNVSGYLSTTITLPHLAKTYSVVVFLHLSQEKSVMAHMPTNSKNSEVPLGNQWLITLQPLRDLLTLEF